MSAVSVVVVEDSPTQRALLVQVIEEARDAVVVAEAVSCEQAVETVARLHPDVVTMDLEIPGGRGHGPAAGGLAAIEQIMARTPTPILVLSGHAGTPEAEGTVRALAAGATDAVPKPASWTPESRAALRRRLHMLRGVAVVGRSAADIPVRGRRSRVASTLAAPPRAGDHVVSLPPPRGAMSPIVGIVASTGGPLALRRVIRDLIGLPAPVLIVQHLHPEFLDGFVRWLADTTGAAVQLLRAGEIPDGGGFHLAPGDRHSRLLADGRIGLSDLPESLHRPSGDELLHSLAAHAGAAAVGAVLTGMGEDGAAGLRAIRDRGGAVLAQDRESCAVYGMPRAALDLGAVDHGTPLSEIGAEIAAACAARRRWR